MILYSFHPEAAEELAEASRFFESRLDGLGSAFADAVEVTITLTRQYPEAGTPFGRSRRRALVRTFPYAVIYEYRTGSIFILAVAHLGRRPGYWRTRE